MEGNPTATGITGGISINSSIVSGSEKNSITPAIGRTVSSKLPFGLGIIPDSDTGTTLSLIAYSPDAGVTADFTFQWEEVR